MTIRRFLCALLSLALLFSLSLPAVLADSGPSGTWVLASYREGSAMLSFLDADAAKDWLGIYVEISFQGNGRYQYTETVDGDVYQESGSWQLGGASLTLTSTAGDTMAFQYQNGVLTYGDGDFEMGFVAAGTQKLYGPNGAVVASASPVSASSALSGFSAFFGGQSSGSASNAGTARSSSAGLAGTHWVATGMSTELLDWIEFDTGIGGISIGDLTGLITFVPNEKSLTGGFYLSACYAALDLNADSTFTLTMKISVMGQLQPDSTETIMGVWSESDGVLTLSSEGSPVPCVRNGSKLSIGMSGMALDFELQ